MKLAITVLVAIALLTFGGLFAWERTQVAGSAADADAFQQEAQARQEVQVTFVVQPPADSTPTDQTVYISGSHPSLGSWDAAGLPLERDDDGTFRGSATMLSGIDQEFKITRGSWSTVERTADDQDVDNRSFTVEPETTLNVEVQAWVDQGQTIPNRITTTGDIRLHERRFASVVDPTKPRSLVVYLPQGYDDPQNADTTYPVLYFHDGQNLFNEATTFAGVEWKLDEALQSLIATDAIPPVIVVGVYNTENRDAEYGPQIADYAEHLAKTIKPFVDQTYRTQPGREHTTLAGAALGGRAALEAARRQPETFGAVIALSPWIVDADGDNVLDDWTAAEQDTQAWAGRTTFYLDTVDDPTYYATATPAADFALLTGWLDQHQVDATHKVHDPSEAEHREGSWGQRAVSALLWRHSNPTPDEEQLSAR